MEVDTHTVDHCLLYCIILIYTVLNFVLHGQYTPLSLLNNHVQWTTYMYLCILNRECTF